VWLRCFCSGIVTTVAGSGVWSFADGVGTAASFREPRGISMTPSGDIIVVDIFSNLIRKITPSGTFFFLFFVVVNFRIY
jgi:hypothetical protein